jgi:hypothetical protein
LLLHPFLSLSYHDFPPWSCCLFLLGLIIKFSLLFPFISSILPLWFRFPPHFFHAAILSSLLHISFLIEISPHLLKFLNSPRTEVSILTVYSLKIHGIRWKQFLSV